MKKTRVTVKDVAAAAGVSPMTASRVLNGSLKAVSVSEDKRDAVMKAAARMGYVTNLMARAVRTGRTSNVGLVVPRYADRELPTEGLFYVPVIEGLEHELLAQNYNVLISSVSVEDVRGGRIPRVAEQRMVDGLVFLAVLNREYLAKVSGAFGRVVALDEDPGGTCPCILSDNPGGGEMAGQHLCNLGHRKMAAITGNRTDANLQARMRGFRTELKRRGCEIVCTCKGDPFVPEGGYHAMREILALEPRPTAVFCANDFLAIHAMRAVREAGLRIPEEISVVGYDDIDSSRYVDPPLTTVSVPKRDMGREAARMILRLIAGETPDPRRVRVSVKLELRESTAPPS